MLPQSPVVAPAAPPAPAAPSPDVARQAKVYVDGKPLTSPQEVYRGFVHQRDELVRQLQELQDGRADVARQLNNENAITAAEKQGLERRLTSLDARIEAVDKQLAAADAQVASAAAVPGAVVDPPQSAPRHDDTQEAPFILGVIFMFVAILPISVAFSRRIWRRSPKAVALPGDIAERFAQLDHAMESIAVEVERIGEGQRFITRVLSEPTSRAALGAAVAAEKAELPRRTTG